jgi:hypothetical protein
MRGFTGAVWEITARMATSTFISAPQQGQVRSKLESVFAIPANHTAKLRKK